MSNFINNLVTYLFYAKKYINILDKFNECYLNFFEILFFIFIIKEYTY